MRILRTCKYNFVCKIETLMFIYHQHVIIKVDLLRCVIKNYHCFMLQYVLITKLSVVCLKHEFTFNLNLHNFILTINTRLVKNSQDNFYAELCKWPHKDFYWSYTSFSLWSPFCFVITPPILAVWPQLAPP